MSWISVLPPVPAVKRTKAVFPPTVAGMLIGQLVEKLLLATLSDAHGQIAAVIGHVHIENMRAMQVDRSIGQIHKWRRRWRSVGIEPGRVHPFARLVVKIELHRHALGDAGRPSR